MSTFPLLAASTTTLDVSELILLNCKQIDATNAATPLASFTTKVCIEKITDSSLLSVFNSP